MAEALVKEMIKNNVVMVFSKTYCPFCNMAKEALKNAGLQQVIFEICCSLHFRISFHEN